MMKPNNRYAQRVAGYNGPSQSNKGEVFSLMDEIERLMKWYRENKPDALPAITLPHRWKGKPVAELLPKFAQLDTDGTSWNWQGFRLTFPPESARDMRRIAPKK